MRSSISGSTGSSWLYTKREDLDRRLDEAEGYLILRMPERVLQVLQSRAIWAPRQFDFNYFLGEALRLQGRYREALKALELASAINPEHVKAALALGWCYKRTHRLAQAIDALERAKRTAPLSHTVRYNLACYWCLAGNTRQALEELRIALDLKPRLRFKAYRDDDFINLRRNPVFLDLCDAQLLAPVTFS